MSPEPISQPASLLTNDQKRAAHAYDCVQGVGKDQLKEYKIAVNSLATNIKRCGLAAAMAFLERGSDRDANTLLIDHLKRANIAGITDSTESLTKQVSELELTKYMLATRELLKWMIWFRRAVQAHPI
ncbi:MAG: type III-B CRISPR module-associated protein Cmr5 [Magnetococcus sp. DMHC-6]